MVKRQTSVDDYALNDSSLVSSLSDLWLKIDLVHD